MSLASEMTLLADGFRKRFSTTDRLTIADMIKLVTPPKYPFLIPTNGWRIAHNYNGALTDDGGSTILSGFSIILASTMKNYDLLKKLHSAGDVTIRFHIVPLEINGGSSTSAITTCFDGQRSVIHIPLKIGVESTQDLTLSKTELTGGNLNLYIICQSASTVQIDVSKSYIEIVTEEN
jgi:hypothetical protein